MRRAIVVVGAAVGVIGLLYWFHLADVVSVSYIASLALAIFGSAILIGGHQKPAAGAVLSEDDEYR